MAASGTNLNNTHSDKPTQNEAGVTARVAAQVTAQVAAGVTL
jgi:hypothetical protein